MTPSRRRPDRPRFAELDAEYEILRELGRGGTAVVYLARERELGREVALKVIRAPYVDDEEASARLMREARVVGRLQHPNIAMLYGTRRLTDGSLALIMQYVPGHTLKDEIRANGPLSFERVRDVLRDVAGALDHAHRQRVIHRDIKPENIYIDERTGAARLSDFGIARTWDADSGLTLPGSALGTPAYMAPEQIDGDALDGRSDLYSLGIVGYEMVSGRRPWAGESLLNVIYRQKNEELPPLADVRPGIPHPLRIAIEGALRKDPALRWADAAQFLEALAGRLESPEAAAAAAPAPVAGPPSPPRTPAEAESSPVATTPEAAHTPPAPDPPQPSGPVLARLRAAEPERRPGPQVSTGAADDPDSLTIRYRRPDAVARPAASASPGSTRETTPAAPPNATPASAVSPTVAPIPATPATGAPPNPASTRSAATPRLLQRKRRVRIGAAVLLVSLAAAAAAVMVVPWTEAPAATEVGPVDPPQQPAASGPEVSPGAGLPAGDAVAAGAPALLYAVMGAVQDGMRGDTLPEPLMVRVEDAAGRAVAGVTVRFDVTVGNGAVVPPVTTTDETGVAMTRWIPNQSGQHAVEATTAALPGRSTMFRARVTPRPPARITTLSPARIEGTFAGDAATLRVRVEDDRGAPVPGAEVRFTVASGEGSIGPAVTRTGPDGTATAEWTLGSESQQQAVASLGARPDARVAFAAAGAPPRLPIRRGLAAGGTHTCVLGNGGIALCWGGNDAGQLGDGSTARRGSSAQVVAPEPLARLEAGVSHTCAVGVSGGAWCWGANTAGQLGDGTRTSRTRPVRVRLDSRLTLVAVGTSHSCGLDAEGGAWCWGDNGRGQLGDGSRDDRAVPVRAAAGLAFRDLALGWSHTCGLLRDGAVVCWGRNGTGELGDGTTTDRVEPVRVAGGHRFSAIAAGSSHTCGLRTDGAVLCWGQNTWGQLGNGSTTSSTTPRTVDAPAATTLTLGSVHSCALGRDGVARCWGRNNYGQLGDGSTQDRHSPVAVSGPRFTALTTSAAHTCGLSGEGWHCWGYNLEGQLGDGTRTNQTRPVPVGREGAVP